MLNITKNIFRKSSSSNKGDKKAFVCDIICIVYLWEYIYKKKPEKHTVMKNKNMPARNNNIIEYYKLKKCSLQLLQFL